MEKNSTELVKEVYILEYAQHLLNTEPLATVLAYANSWLEKEPDSLEALQFSGMLYVKHNDLSRALQCFKKATFINPKEVSYHTNLSNIYTSLGKVEKAKIHLHQALRLQPLHAEAYNNLGRLYYKQKLFENAILHFKKALRIDPDYWEAHYNLAHSFASLNQINRAATHYREVLRLFPEHPIANFNLGLAYLNEENYIDAEKYLSQTLELDPNNLAALIQLGRTYIALGHTKEAMDTYRKALNLNAESSEIHHNLAILFLRNEEKEKALFHFQEALKLDTTNNTARHMVMALGNSQATTAAPPQYISELFDQYADYYDEHLKNKLKYQVPGLLRNAVGRCLEENPKAGRVLDMGCGTGLCGIFFRDLALDLIGIDLSAKMIAKATTLGAYEKLLVTDLNEYLSKPDLQAFDLIVAGDVLVYSGDLSQIFGNVAKALVAKGRFTFSIELLEIGTYYLQPSGRFAHSHQYIHKLAKQNDFIIELEENIIPREHEGKPVSGQIYVLRKE